MKYYKVPEDQLRKLLEIEDIFDSLLYYIGQNYLNYASELQQNDLAARMNIELSKFEKLPD